MSNALNVRLAELLAAAKGKPCEVHLLEDTDAPTDAELQPFLLAYYIWSMVPEGGDPYPDKHRGMSNDESHPFTQIAYATPTQFARIVALSHQGEQS